MASSDETLDAEAPAGGVLQISLSALRANYRQLRALAGGAAVAGVVKADAYGLGAAVVVPALLTEGCRSFFVAQLGEATALRSLLPPDAELFVLNGLSPGAEGPCAAIGAVPVLNSLDQIRRWGAEAARRGAVLPAALQVDSGMSRLGLSPAEVEAIAAEPARLAGIRTVLVMSHLACADEPAHPASAHQRAAFRELVARLPHTRLSLANSAGLFLGPDYGFDLARPGIALYGGNPVADGRANPMQPVVRLQARVVQTRDVPAGAGIGYGFSRVADRPMRLATVGVGYADGWPRALSNRAAAYLGDHRLPIAGRVSMDSTILDVTDLTAMPQPGALVDLIGPHQTLDAVAELAGMISYEILTSLGDRFERRIVREG
ncbi:alanine racemase [Aureimonas jatrophae]|uniref:Alanine racemase n=1 Tax=Aureimonas jatrophae TaxID=1166073 RepID=A0A1H0L8I0_9HYPH|nr:alanine racemase [Aureimonas jatrophae]SDO64415.1 alanine racemase [Aureimonas jatrophae]